MAKAAQDDKPPRHRNSAQLRGVRSQLVAAINCSSDGAYAQVNLTTARSLVEVCDQAIRTEVGHEPSSLELAEIAARMQ